MQLLELITYLSSCGGDETLLEIPWGFALLGSASISLGRWHGFLSSWPCSSCKNSFLQIFEGFISDLHKGSVRGIAKNNVVYIS